MKSDYQFPPRIIMLFALLVVIIVTYQIGGFFFGLFYPVDTKDLQHKNDFLIEKLVIEDEIGLNIRNDLTTTFTIKPVAGLKEFQIYSNREIIKEVEIHVTYQKDIEGYVNILISQSEDVTLDELKTEKSFSFKILQELPIQVKNKTFYTNTAIKSSSTSSSLPNKKLVYNMAPVHYTIEVPFQTAITLYN